MGFFRKIGSFLGFVKDEAEELKDEEEKHSVSSTDSVSAAAAAAQHLPRKGFSVAVQFPVDRPGPLLVPCSFGNGGVQGFRWYAKQLRIDEDGDVADEFLDEILPEKSVSFEEHKRPLPSFQVKYNTRPVKTRDQVRLIDGKIQLGVEFQGRLEWV